MKCKLFFLPVKKKTSEIILFWKCEFFQNKIFLRFINLQWNLQRTWTKKTGNVFISKKKREIRKFEDINFIAIFRYENIFHCWSSTRRRCWYYVVLRFGERSGSYRNTNKPFTDQLQKGCLSDFNALVLLGNTFIAKVFFSSIFISPMWTLVEVNDAFGFYELI